jgi:NAD(P)-dependent dehydrogenase (short-subunit alcohol dehydrogenase family)
MGQWLADWRCHGSGFGSIGETGMSVSDGVILVTGANGGLGSSIVQYLLEKGFRNVACHYRTSDEEIKGILSTADLDPARHAHYAELTREEDIRAMREAIENRLGPVQTLVNLAGGSSNGMSWKLSKADFQQIVDMNLLSTFLCSKEFVPGMRERQYGTIINTSSTVGTIGVAGAAHYCAAKAAIVGLTKAMALELANKNITVNVLALGYFTKGIIAQIPEAILKTIIDRIPFKHLGEPREVGALIEYLIGDDARYTTGQTFHLNGGLAG